MDGLHVAFVGRIGQDPERRFTARGAEILQFSVLPADSRAADTPEWVKCSVFVDKLDEHAVDKLTKGAEVYVEGRLKLGRWTSQDGAPRSSLNVNAWTVQPMGQIGRRLPQQTDPRSAKPVAIGERRRTDWPPEAAG
jgi:single-strand DNA-binding protein